MADFVKVRGLTRSGNGVRINNRAMKSTTTRVLDMDDGATRKELARHSALGHLVVVGDTDFAVSRTGAVVTPGTTTTVSVSAGTLKIANPSGGVAPSQAIAAVANAAIALNALGTPRTDIVQVATATGAATVKTGVASSAAVVAADAGNIAIATVTVPSPLVASTGYTITDVSPRL